MSEPGSPRRSEDSLELDAGVVEPAAPAGGGPRAPGTRVLALAALGVVFGDIGTSPLYAVKECFFGIHAIPPTPANVLGVLSLIVWSLTLVVSFKYIGFILRADKRGEGGIFALLALIAPATRRRGGFAAFAALLGAALLYGDGIITPAISVLAAVEGLEVATSAFVPVIIPLTVLILLGIFALQRKGSGGVGRIFGPVMILWFLALAALGLRGIFLHPGVLAALSPHHALAFFLENRLEGLVVLGAVVLCLTGVEALYADLGHFGRTPIRLGWFALAFPSLLLNYAGQGAILLAEAEPPEVPFFALAPRPLLLPLVILATLATAIASQALIAGAFSLSRQAIQLGYLPRMRIVHTSGASEGQIFIPSINRLLMVACLLLVLSFQRSSNLAGAYGVAVTAQMGITSTLFFLVCLRRWRWSPWRAVPLLLLFLIFDLSFFGANLVFKLLEGGWLPIAVALGMLTIMRTWSDGRAALRRQAHERVVPLEELLDDLKRSPPPRASGTAVFLSPSPIGAPSAMLHHLKHNHVLHEQVVILSILVSEAQPVVDRAERVHVEELEQGFFRIQARYGFMQTPNVPEILELAVPQGLVTDPATTSFILGRQTLLTTGTAPMARWRKALFRFLSRNAEPPTAYFRLPPGRVVELGTQIEL